jgi:PAS domain S-box-containing protein
MLIAPLSLKSRLIGLLALDYGGLDPVYTPEEFTLTRAVCRLLAMLIEREDLLALNARLSELIERAHDAVIVCDAANHVLLWNKGAESLYGVSKQEALGKVAHTLLTTRFPVPREQIDTQLAQVGEWEGILTHQRHGGGEVIVESRQVLLHNAVGRPAFILEINRDITEREEARASALAARETTRQMNVFVGIASHELKTPLTSIKGNVQLASRRLTNMLKQVEAKEQVGRASLAEVLLLLERAERQVNVQTRLVSDLIDMSRIQTEKLELRLAKIDLVSLVREVVENQRFVADNHPFHIEVPQEESVLVIADAVRIGQVVGNYLSNAFKYSPVDRPVKVRLTVEHKQRQARVEVADQGPGLSQEQQLHVWERFYRIPSIAVQSGSSIGLGLGLHINRTLIEQHGGQVGVESTPEHGATFWFTLPLAETVAEQDSPLEEKMRPSSGPPNPISPHAYLQFRKIDDKV